MTASAPTARDRWQRYRPQARIACGPPVLAPFVNLALLIMMVMLLHSYFVRQPAAAVSLPAAPFLNGASFRLLVVTVTQEGLVFFDDERIPLHELGAALARAIQERRIEAVTVEADARVPYGVIMRILNMATAAGLQRVNLAARASFGEEIALREADVPPPESGHDE